MRTIYKALTLVVILSSAVSINAQNEFSKWYFGTQCGLDFSTQPPTIMTNTLVNINEGIAIICDSGGNLLFYGGGDGIYNSSNVVMANGAGLFGGNGSSTQGVTYVKQPGNTNIYYVFTADQTASPNGFRYSIVDMTLAAGLGSVTVKNALLYTPTCEKQVAVRHCNGKDVWIISHHYGSNEFRTYLLNSAGVSANPVVSAIGETPAGGSAGILSAMGQLKISPDGKKLAMATGSSSIPNSLGSGGFFLFDFDAGTGIVSNSVTLVSGSILNTSPYGVEFSGDGTKLYGSTSPGLSANYTTTLHQWNVCAPTPSAIIASQYSITLPAPFVGSLQRAIDGKIYLTPSNSQSLHVINNPNSSGASMNFVLNGQNIAPGFGRLGFPNFINTYSRIPYTALTNTIACQTVSFSIPPTPTFSSGCTSTPYAPSSYLWDFGEAASGTGNTSTLSNPVHTYSATGTYSVTLILYSNCTNDTLKKVITISTPGPSVNVAGTFLICKGTTKTYTVSGGSTYLWSNNVTTSTTAFSPTITTVYSVTTSLNGCSASKQFTITVDPCNGFADGEKDLALQIFPNPVKDLLFVEADKPSDVRIFDMNGALILETKINSGHNEIDLSRLKGGIYSTEAKEGVNVWRRRVVKID